MPFYINGRLSAFQAEDKSSILLKGLKVSPNAKRQLILPFIQAIYSMGQIILPYLVVLLFFSVWALIASCVYFGRKKNPLWVFFVLCVGCLFLYVLVFNNFIFDSNPIITFVLLCILQIFYYVIIEKRCDENKLQLYCGLIFLVEIYWVGQPFFIYMPSLADLSLEVVLLVSLLLCLLYLVGVFYFFFKLFSRIKKKSLIKLMLLRQKKLSLALSYVKKARYGEIYSHQLFIEDVLLYPILGVSYVLTYGGPLLISVYSYAVLWEQSYGIVVFSSWYVFIITICLATPSFDEYLKKKYGKLFLKACLWNSGGKTALIVNGVAISFVGISAANLVVSKRVNQWEFRQDDSDWLIHHKNVVEDSNSTGGVQQPIKPRPDPRDYKRDLLAEAITKIRAFGGFGPGGSEGTNSGPGAKASSSTTIVPKKPYTGKKWWL